jgi:hypothetical protein
MKKKISITPYVALAFSIGILGAAGCASEVPVAPQTSEQSQTTTTTTRNVPVSTTRTTTSNSSTW